MSDWVPFGIQGFESMNNIFNSTGITAKEAIDSMMGQVNIMFLERFSRRPYIQATAFFENVLGNPGKQIKLETLERIGNGLFEIIFEVPGIKTHVYRIAGTLVREGILPKWKLHGQLTFIE